MDRTTPSTIDNSDEHPRSILAHSIGRRAFLLGAAAAVSYRALGAGWAWADDGVGDIKVGVANAVTPNSGRRPAVADRPRLRTSLRRARD